jgi:hypothetical protein
VAAAHPSEAATKDQLTFGTLPDSTRQPLEVGENALPAKRMAVGDLRLHRDRTSQDDADVMKAPVTAIPRRQFKCQPEASQPPPPEAIRRLLSLCPPKLRLLSGVQAPFRWLAAGILVSAF